MSAVLADSATIVWWLAGQREKFTDAAFDALAEADRTDGIYVSAITLVDVWYATHKRTDALTVDDLGSIDDAISSAEINVHVLPVTAGDATAARVPPRDQVRDPFDRIILATARARSLPLVTPDGILRSLSIVTTIW